MNYLTLLIHSVRRHGFVGCLHRFMFLTVKSIRRRSSVHERHLWYWLDLTVERRQLVMPGGMELVRGGLQDLPLLAQLKRMGMFEAEWRLSDGAELWIAKEGAQAAACCWIFRDRAPLLAARGNWLRLPPNTVILEDVMTHAAYRGRGIAPAVLTQVADDLARRGASAMLAKVEANNVVSQRMVEKAGFVLIAVMTMELRWLKRRVQVIPRQQGLLSEFLAEHLST